MAVRTVGAKTAPALNQIGTPANPTGSFADLETAIRTLGAAVATVATRNVSGTFDGMSAARLGPSPVSAAASINVDSVAHTIELQVFPAGHVFDASADLGSDTDDNAIYCAYFAGDVTILPGVTVTTKRRKRGMAWVVNGTLNNYGTLTMTARGAYNVAGAALLLRAGATVPAAGSAGGVGVVSDNNGTTGTAGASRGTGGGGAGASRSGGTSGAGSAGTGNRSGAGGAGSHVAGANDGSATGFGGLVDGNTSAGA